MNTSETRVKRLGMVIDLDKCNGCGACMAACASENNVPPGDEKATKRTGINWMRVEEVREDSASSGDSVFIPMMCMQCGAETPCVTVCPQNAVEVDKATGIVAQMPERCLGCRYCMAACPYHARSFNWWDPEWPEGMEKTFNPDVAPRMRGVVEKCNFCHGRLHRAMEKAAAEGKPASDAQYIPACAESCPTGAIVFGDLADPSSEAARLAQSIDAFRFLSRLGTEPNVFYLSKKPWVRTMADWELARTKKETVHG